MLYIHCTYNNTQYYVLQRQYILLYKHLFYIYFIYNIYNVEPPPI